MYGHGGRGSFVSVGLFRPPLNTSFRSLGELMWPGITPGIRGTFHQWPCRCVRTCVSEEVGSRPSEAQCRLKRGKGGTVWLEGWWRWLCWEQLSSVVAVYRLVLGPCGSGPRLPAVCASQPTGSGLLDCILPSSCPVKVKGSRTNTPAVVCPTRALRQC